MQIIIDTKKDTDEEIKKAIKFLESIIGNAQQQDFQPEVSASAFNMFDTPNEPEEKDEEEKYDETPKIEPY